MKMAELPGITDSKQVQLIICVEGIQMKYITAKYLPSCKHIIFSDITLLSISTLWSPVIHIIYVPSD